MAIIGIAAVDLNMGIGKAGQLLFHIKEDLENFRKITEGKTVVMGKNTFLSLPNQQPLSDRTNVVLSTDSTILGCINVHSIDEILKLAEKQDIYIIGGAQLYKEMLPYYDEILLTRVYAIEDADTFFPLIKDKELEIVDVSDIIKSEKYDFQYVKYKRKEKKKK